MERLVAEGVPELAEALAAVWGAADEGLAAGVGALGGGGFVSMSSPRADRRVMGEGTTYSVNIQMRLLTETLPAPGHVTQIPLLRPLPLHLLIPPPRLLRLLVRSRAGLTLDCAHQGIDIGGENRGLALLGRRLGGRRTVPLVVVRLGRVEHVRLGEELVGLDGPVLFGLDVGLAVGAALAVGLLERRGDCRWDGVQGSCGPGEGAEAGAVVGVGRVVGLSEGGGGHGGCVVHGEGVDQAVRWHRCSVDAVVLLRWSLDPRHRSSRRRSVRSEGHRKGRHRASVVCELSSRLAHPSLPQERVVGHCRRHVQPKIRCLSNTVCVSSNTTLLRQGTVLAAENFA